MLTNDHGICIRAVDYSETSQVVTFFARQTGKVPVIAKGAKRQKSSFGGPIEIFSYGTIVFSDSGRDKLATLAEFEPLAGMVNYPVLSADIFALNACLLAAELVNALVNDYDPHPGLFDSLLQFIHDASQDRSSNDEHRKILANLIVFQLVLLTEIGLCPILDYCVNCRNHFDSCWPETYFSNNARGLICRDCQGPFPDKIRLTAEAAKCLADSKLLVSASQTTLKNVEDILIRYITDMLGRPLRMAKYILNA
ncbi:MAG: DNA repair protein RecO [Sedimentisphaerales bacterium]|jgi:DNA repair protein RecO (recombination protein O)